MPEDRIEQKVPAQKYPWQRELEQLIRDREEKGIRPTVLRYPDGKIPLSAALDFIEEHMARPEIMKVLSNVGLREHMKDDDLDLWRAFKTFLRMRQPTSPDRSPHLGVLARAMACGEYTGASDPKLIEAILRDKKFFFDDRNVQ
jgi:hypothetical protein